MWSWLIVQYTLTALIYTQPDQPWAEWISWQPEDADYSTSAA